jgi:hypothetical protein
MYIEYYVVRASASQTRPTHLESEMCTQWPLMALKHENQKWWIFALDCFLCNRLEFKNKQLWRNNCYIASLSYNFLVQVSNFVLPFSSSVISQAFGLFDPFWPRLMMLTYITGSCFHLMWKQFPIARWRVGKQ